MRDGREIANIKEYTKNKTDAQLDAWLTQTKVRDLHFYDVSCELWRKEV
tara:strand:- start:96 stop:242 length:147 start_codon:yes stop_codon:yes gene_type:complete